MMLQDIFIPGDGFLDAHIDKLQGKMSAKFGLDGIENKTESLKDGKEEKTKFGKYINLDIFENHRDTIKGFLRLIFYPLFIFGDIRFIMWLIRGSSFGGGSG